MTALLLILLGVLALLVVGVVWLLSGPGWAALLFVALVLGGGAVVYRGLKQR